MIRRMTPNKTARSSIQPRFSFQNRTAGVLLHPTSLPGPHGCGDIGAEALRFIEFLAEAGATWWQMLPTNPPAEITGCPYSTDSSWAGNPLLISLDGLIADGLLTRRDCVFEDRNNSRVDFRRVTRHRDRVLRLAFSRFRKAPAGQLTAFSRFCEQQSNWLDEYTLFAALRTENRGRVWYRWPLDVRRRKPTALAAARERLVDEIDYVRFVQYAFASQWLALRRAAQQRGIGLIGDVPIFVGHDSCDVWANQDLFMVDDAGKATLVSGVPPDKFSKTGQVWNHPHYRWARHLATGFEWWIERFRGAMHSFDAVRIDHFLGFVRCWAIPGGAKTGVRGKWIDSLGSELFKAVRAALRDVNIIAEDLGLLTPEAAALRDAFKFPGMRVMQWGFGADGDSRYHQPHRFSQNCIAYPGTHDNDTTVGWFRKLDRAVAARVLRYYAAAPATIHQDMIRSLLASPANTAIIAMQDLLGLGTEARMNLPGTTRGNWQWRMRRNAADAKLSRQFRDWNATYERLPKAAPLESTTTKSKAAKRTDR